MEGMREATTAAVADTAAGGLWRVQSGSALSCQTGAAICCYAQH